MNSHKIVSAREVLDDASKLKENVPVMAKTIAFILNTPETHPEIAALVYEVLDLILERLKSNDDDTTIMAAIAIATQLTATIVAESLTLHTPELENRRNVILASIMHALTTKTAFLIEKRKSQPHLATSFGKPV